MELVISIVVAIFVAVLITETYAWLPKITKLILDRAARRLDDPKDQERYLTEWNANLEDLPNTLLKLVHAISHYLAADRIKIEIVDAKWNSRYGFFRITCDNYEVIRDELLDILEGSIKNNVKLTLLSGEGSKLNHNLLKVKVDDLSARIERMDALISSISEKYFETDLEYLSTEEKMRYLKELTDEASEYVTIASESAEIVYWVASGGEPYQPPDP